MGAEILAADRNEELVNEAAKYCTSSVCADLSNEENLQALGLKDMDIVVVAMAKNLEASIISVSVSKELEVPLIVAKSGSARMSSILEKIGADRVVIPEEYAGERWAKILISETILDFFEVDSSLCMIEMKPLEKMDRKVGKRSGSPPKKQDQHPGFQNRKYPLDDGGPQSETGCRHQASRCYGSQNAGRTDRNGIGSAVHRIHVKDRFEYPRFCANPDRISAAFFLLFPSILIAKQDRN